MFVRPAVGHAPHDGQRIIRRGATVLAGARLSDPQFRVLPCAPVDRQDDVAHDVIDIGHDVGHQRGASAIVAGPVLNVANCSGSQ